MKLLKPFKTFKCLSTNYRYFHNIIKNASTGDWLSKQLQHSPVLAHVTESVFAFWRICFSKTCTNKKGISPTDNFFSEGLNSCSGQSGIASNKQSLHCFFPLHTLREWTVQSRQEGSSLDVTKQGNRGKIEGLHMEYYRALRCPTSQIQKTRSACAHKTLYQLYYNTPSCNTMGPSSHCTI